MMERSVLAGDEAPAQGKSVQKTQETVLVVLAAISFSHLLNDTIQALIPAIYPLLKASFHLSFAQLGLITFSFQCTASLLQPLVGMVTDRRSLPWALAMGMGATMAGLLWLSVAHNFPMILASASLVGLGSAVFHPNGSRIAHMAAGQRRGFAQSIFQVGGNAGTSIGPLLAAFVVVPHGQGHLSWFALVALLGVVVLWNVGAWQRRNAHRIERPVVKTVAGEGAHLPQRTVIISLLILVVLVFSKYVYLTSMTSYYTFYLIEKFRLSVQQSQIYLFVFLFAVAAGTIIGGPLGDRIGRKRVIWGSILGVAPFTLYLPYAGLEMTVVLTVAIGMILASAFSAILVYAQELVPGKVGLIAGLFFGIAFGIAGIGSAALGRLADATGIEHVFRLCAFLPLLGLLTVLLPDIESRKR